MVSRPVADWLFDRYVRRLVTRHFSSVRWLRTGLQAGQTPDGPGGPSSAIFVANHTNWWDGFLAWLVSREFGLRFHILMDATNLDRYWMFKRIGALPMHRDRRTAAYRDLGAAGGKLTGAGNSLWVFPQGVRRPPDEPIESTEHGAAHLAIEHRTEVVPVAFRYRFLGEQFPEAFIQVGEGFVAASTERRAVAAEIERRMQLTVASLDARLRAEQIEGFGRLLQGRLSVNKQLDRVRHAAGMIDGPYEARNG